MQVVSACVFGSGFSASLVTPVSFLHSEYDLERGEDMNIIMRYWGHLGRGCMRSRGGNTETSLYSGVVFQSTVEEGADLFPAEKTKKKFYRHIRHRMLCRMVWDLRRYI